MVKENQSLVRMRGWQGGLNTEADPRLLNQTESASMLNVDIGVTGEIEKRKGYSKWSTSDPAAMAKGEDLWHFNNGTNNFLILRDTDNDVWDVNSDSGTVFTASQIAGPTDLDVDSECDAIVMNDTFYISGTASPNSAYKFDGSTWTEITDNTLNGSGTEFPLATALAVHRDVVFAGGISTITSRLHWSDPIKPETWPTNNFIDIQPDDGGIIHGLISFRDVLFIFKEQSIHALAGTDNDTFSLYPVSERFGTASPRSIINFGDKIIWFDPLNGVMSYDGTDIEHVDRKINSRILDNADLSSPRRTVRAFGRKEKYYLSVDWTAGGRRTFILDLRIGSWTEYDFGPMHVALLNIADLTLYAVQATDDGKGVWKLFDTENDDGSAVSSSFETHWFAPEEGALQEHRLLKMFVYFRAESGTAIKTVTVDLYTDYKTSVKESLIIDIVRADQDQMHDGIINFENHSADVFQINFSHNTASTAWRLNALDFLFLDRIIPTGKDL